MATILAEVRKFLYYCLKAKQKERVLGQFIGIALAVYLLREMTKEAFMKALFFLTTLIMTAHSFGSENEINEEVFDLVHRGMETAGGVSVMKVGMFIAGKDTPKFRSKKIKSKRGAGIFTAGLLIATDGVNGVVKNYKSITELESCKKNYNFRPLSSKDLDKDFSDILDNL